MRFAAKALPLLPLALLAGCQPREGKAQVVAVRVVPYTTASGLPRHMVLVDWKNTGEADVSEARADIQVYDAAGQPTDSVKDYVIFAAEEGEGTHPIRPGETYVEADDMGHVVSAVHGGEPARADASITYAGAFEHPDQ